MTRLINVLGGSGRPAKYVVSPQPERIAAIIRAAAELNQRLLFFKIPYLYGKQNVRDWVAAAAVKKSRWRLPIPATIGRHPARTFEYGRRSTAGNPVQPRFQQCF
jgi:hypothetical protein